MRTLVYRILMSLYYRWGPFFIMDVYRTNYARRALIIYEPLVFTGVPDWLYFNTHNRWWRSRALGAILDNLGFRVDVLRHDSPCQEIKNHYDCVVGLSHAVGAVKVGNPDSAFRIGITTEVESTYFRQRMQERASQFQSASGVVLPTYRQGLFNEKDISLCDTLFVIGDEWVSSTYHVPKRVTKECLYNSVDESCLEFIERDYKDAHKRFIYMTGNDQLLGGLDLLIEIFSRRTDCELHICCSLNRERVFYRWFKKRTAQSKNIIYHGFVRTETEKFRTICRKCAYLILPQCVAATHPSVLTCMAKGLVPIIPQSLGVDFGDFAIAIDELDVVSVDKAVEHALKHSEGEYNAAAIAAFSRVREKYTHKWFYDRLQRLIEKAVKDVGLPSESEGEEAPLAP